MISDTLILQLIIAISQFCSTAHNTQPYKGQCFETIWNCGHNTKDADIIITKTHRCIKDYLDQIK